MVPREERPSIDELEETTESRYPPEIDYTPYRRELAIWLHDYRRDEELKRSEQQRTLLPGHQAADLHEQRYGYTPDSFDLEKVAADSKQRPLH